MSSQETPPAAPAGPAPGATAVIDSVIFRNSFGTPEMRAVFSDRALMARCIEVEVALARIRRSSRISASTTVSYTHLTLPTN